MKKKLYSADNYVELNGRDQIWIFSDRSNLELEGKVRVPDLLVAKFNEIHQKFNELKRRLGVEDPGVILDDLKDLIQSYMKDKKAESADVIKKLATETHVDMNDAEKRIAFLKNRVETNFLKLNKSKQKTITVLARNTKKSEKKDVNKKMKKLVRKMKKLFKKGKTTKLKKKKKITKN